MYFDNFSELWAMAGHGPYVWAAYAIAAGVLLALILLPLRRMKQFKRELRGQRRRQQARPANTLSPAAGD